MAKKNKRQDPYNDWFNEQSAVPRNDEPIEKKNKRYRWIRRAIYVSAYLGIFSTLVSVTTLATQPEIPEYQQPNLSPGGKATAVNAVNEWLSATPMPVVGGSILSWDGATQVDRPDYSEQQIKELGMEDENYTVEQHHFSIIDKQKQVYSVEVEVALDPETGAHVIGEPSLIPVVGQTGEYNGQSVWPGLRSGDVPASVETSVNAWTEAFTSGNGDALRQAVADPNGEHQYLPLKDVAEANATVAEGARFVHFTGQDEIVEEDRMLVRVQIAVRWQGQKVGEGQDLPVLTYDLLVHNVDSGAPQIVAWGGPGSGQSLEPFENAITGRDLAQMKNGDETSDPAPTENPDPKSADEQL